MSVQSEITRIQNEVDAQTDLISQITTALTNKVAGSGGVDLPSLTNAGSASDLLYGKQLINENNEVVTGEIPTISVIAPTISVNSSGRITAEVMQDAGYIATAETKKTTKQLTTKSATIYTPGTTNQTIASGTYLTGNQTIKGDLNLIPENIASGVSIFGIEGSLKSGDGSSSELTNATLSIDYSSGCYGVIHYTTVENGTITYKSINFGNENTGEAGSLELYPASNSIIFIPGFNSVTEIVTGCSLAYYYDYMMTVDQVAMNLIQLTAKSAFLVINNPESDF